METGNETAPIIELTLERTVVHAREDVQMRLTHSFLPVALCGPGHVPASLGNGSPESGS